MTYSHKYGNMLDEVKQGIIVQQVNAQGVMGGGIAKSIRDKWPKNWDVYSAVVKPNQRDRGLAYLGMVIYCEVEPSLWIANIVGQQFYGRDPLIVYTSYEALAMGFNSVANVAMNNDLDVHYPLIGCGLANGDWNTVSRIAATQLVRLDHTLWELPPNPN
jgi:O-acetyl-ADP-ribose deacetylase (regulator of RNase III)